MEALQTMLAGRYRLEEVIGRGGMSTVYRAADTVLGRTVAIKVLSPALASDDPVWVARFEREARAAAALSHPAVATVYDTGVRDGTRYIVMECVRGRSLDAVLRAEAPLDPSRAARIGAQIADALSAAHAAGIVHRDVKPGNVMVGPGESVKILDFGIARALDGTALTQTLSVLGTAAYMSPEQAVGKPADARSDIYSLGCVLYAMLAGSPPFASEQAAGIMHQHVSVEPRPLTESARGIPPAMSDLVTEMLAKPAEERPGSAAEVRDRLGAMLEPNAAEARLTTPLITAATVPVARVGQVRRRRRRTLAALLACALLVVVIATATSGGSQTPASSTASSTSASPPPSPTTTSPPTSTTAPPAPPGQAPAATAAAHGKGKAQKPKPPGKAKRRGHGDGGDGGD